MYDICLKTDSQAALITALAPFGMTTEDMEGQTILKTHGPGFDIAYLGRVVETPGVTDPETMEVTTPATFLPGEYAILRGDADVVMRVLEADLDGAEVLTEKPVQIGGFGGEWNAVQTPNLDFVKAETKIKIEAKRDELLRGGYHFTYEGQILFLQTRDDEDRINWLGVLNAATIMVMSGKGADLTKIRTGENATIEIPYYQVQVLMLQTLAYQSSIYEAAWKHKDAIKDMTMEQVLAYDVESGWLS